MDCGDSTMIFSFICIVMVLACIAAIVIESVNGSN